MVASFQVKHPPRRCLCLLLGPWPLALLDLAEQEQSERQSTSKIEVSSLKRVAGGSISNCRRTYWHEYYILLLVTCIRKAAFGAGSSLIWQVRAPWTSLRALITLLVWR
ncbi:hypothetical protein F5Y14DRAFT_305135 [Nemania sp. NC0429]|nr:hypothetical protein F5Y14DRAFT_305135 [Nemania sp. NC0429]